MLILTIVRCRVTMTKRPNPIKNEEQTHTHTELHTIQSHRQKDRQTGMQDRRTKPRQKAHRHVINTYGHGFWSCESSACFKPPDTARLSFVLTVSVLLQTCSALFCHKIFLFVSAHCFLYGALLRERERESLKRLIMRFIEIVAIIFVIITRLFS